MSEKVSMVVEEAEAAKLPAQSQDRYDRRQSEEL